MNSKTLAPRLEQQAYGFFQGLGNNRSAQKQQKGKESVKTDQVALMQQIYYSCFPWEVAVTDVQYRVRSAKIAPTSICKNWR